MLSVLMESRAARPRRIGGTLASTLVHGGLVAGAVLLSQPGTGGATVRRDFPRDTIIYVAPPPVHVERPPRRQLSRASDGGSGLERLLPELIAPNLTPVGLPPIDPGARPITDDILAGRTHTFGGDGVVGWTAGPGTVMESALTDRAPRPVGQLAQPRYPASLRDAGVRGRVVVQFVVDTLGRPEPDEVQIVEASHPLFADAVLAALARYRFTPGEAGGRRVRTRVQIPFDFTMAP